MPTKQFQTSDGHQVEIVVRPDGAGFEATVYLDGGEMYWDGDVAYRKFHSAGEAEDAAYDFLLSVGLGPDR